MSGYKKYIIVYKELKEIEINATSLDSAIESAKLLNGECIEKYDYEYIYEVN